MKIYARQINPECQDSGLFDNDCLFEYISIRGNRDFHEHVQPVFERVYSALDCGELAEELENIKYSEYYKNATAAIYDLLPPEKEKYSTRDIHALKNLVADYASCARCDENDILCSVLSVVTGNDWTYSQICGCCQSEWNYAYYQEKDFPNGIYDIEVMYFNTGSEWIVHDESNTPEGPEDISGWSIYCIGWSDDKIKAEIADVAGVKPEDVVLYKWAGYAKIATYEVA